MALSVPTERALMPSGRRLSRESRVGTAAGGIGAAAGADAGGARGAAEVARGRGTARGVGLGPGFGGVFGGLALYADDGRGGGGCPCGREPMPGEGEAC